MYSSSVEQLVVDLSKDPLSPTLNYEVGRKYDELGQTAAATGFFLRAAEYGHETHMIVAYMALLRIASCMERQKDRGHTAKNNLQQAIALAPYQPQAYFLLARHYEQRCQWEDCYTTACIGLYFANDSSYHQVDSDLEYYGRYVLEFEKAVSGWWIGRRNESKKIFEKIIEMGECISPEYLAACRSNLEKL
jgi:tetratricopeptide (TPR) repeat protein